MSAQERAEQQRLQALAALRARSEATECQGTDGRITGDRAEVVVAIRGCRDYFIADGPNGQYLLEWYGGHSPSRGDIIIGPINSYGFKDVCYPGKGTGRVWVDDYLLSKSRAQEKYLEKCQ